MITSDGDGNLATSSFDLAVLESLPGRIENVEITNIDQNNRLTNVEQVNTDQNARITIVENKNIEQDFALVAQGMWLTELDGRVTTNTQNIAILDNRVTSLESGFQNLGNQISENRKEARGGTALALATAGLRYDDRPEKLSIAGGVGHFKGLTGLSFGVGYNTSESLRFNAAVSGVPENGDVGFSAGASWTLN